MKALHLLKISVGARWAVVQLRELVRLGIDCHVVVPDDCLLYTSDAADE